MDVFYRLSQLWHNVTAQPLSQPEIEEISQVLIPGEMALLRQLSNSDQQHAYRVYQLLRASGHTDADLLAAALLHDSGKVRVNLSVWDRSIAVLGETVAPHKVVQWGQGDETGWKSTFVVREQHAAWGASLAEKAGSRPGVIDLIMRHQDSLTQNGCEQNERLMLLQWADDQN